MGEGHWLVAFGTLLAELLVLLFVVSGSLALAVRRLGSARLQAWLGGGPLRGALKGIGVGFLIPFCTYSAVPAFVGMVEARVRSATLAGFALAAPLLDPVVAGVLWLLFGWRATLAYTLVTASTIVALALLAEAAHAERLLRRRPVVVPTAPVAHEPAATSETCRADPYADDAPWAGLAEEAHGAARYAAGLVRQLALPMILAVAVAAAIIGFVPEALLARMAGPGNPFAVPAAALLGAPFYVSTEAFLPIVSALHERGMAVGAAFALVISAAGVNVPELALLSRVMRPGLLAGYTAAIVAIAIAAGQLVPLLL